MGLAWVSTDEAVFYAFCWTMAFLSGTLTMLGGTNSQPFRVCAVAGSLSGFLAVAVVSLLSGYADDGHDHHWRWVGVSILVGLSARRGEEFRERIIDIFFAAMETAVNQFAKGGKNHRGHSDHNEHNEYGNDQYRDRTPTFPDHPAEDFAHRDSGIHGVPGGEATGDEQLNGGDIGEHPDDQSGPASDQHPLPGQERRPGDVDGFF